MQSAAGASVWGRSAGSSGSDPGCRNKFQAAGHLYLRKQCAAHHGSDCLAWERCTHGNSRAAGGAADARGCRTPCRPCCSGRGHRRECADGHPGLAQAGWTRPPPARWRMSPVLQGDARGLPMEASRSRSSVRGLQEVWRSAPRADPQAVFWIVSRIVQRTRPVFHRLARPLASSSVPGATSQTTPCKAPCCVFQLRSVSNAAIRKSRHAIENGLKAQGPRGRKRCSRGLFVRG